MDNIIIIGGGGHAKVIISILKRLEFYRILGYIDPVDRGVILDTPYLGKDSDLEKIIKNYPECGAAIGLGMIKTIDAQKRADIIDRLKFHGFKIPPIIAPDAVVDNDSKIGEGSVLMDGAIVNTCTNIGRGCILNTNCSVDHDCTIGDFVHIAPGVTISGGVQIENNVMVGAGATIIQNIQIKTNAFIGAGSVVINNINESGIFVGNPAKKIK